MIRTYRARAAYALCAGSRATSQQGQMLSYRTVGKVPSVKASEEFVARHMKFSSRNPVKQNPGLIAVQLDCNAGSASCPKLAPDIAALAEPETMPIASDRVDHARSLGGGDTCTPQEYGRQSFQTTLQRTPSVEQGRDLFAGPDVIRQPCGHGRGPGRGVHQHLHGRAKFTYM